jgi:AraC family ethanolamine operon transcriptional activator
LIARDRRAAFTALVPNSDEDLEQLQACFDGWDVELIQLGPLRDTGWASLATLPDSRVIRLRAGRPLVVRGTAPAVDGSLMLSASPEAAVRWLGQSLDDSRFVVAGRRASVDIFLPSSATLYVITAKVLVGIPPRRIQMHTTTSERIAQLISCAASTTNHDASRDSAYNPLAIDALIARQVSVVMEESAIDMPRATRRSRRPTAVECACNFIGSRLRKPIGLDDLCGHCGVGVRTLEYGFRQFYDATPIGFIKSQRLTRTHRMLSQACTQAISISEIARSMGFTHMGQYAQDYRLLFGESPTMTLQRTQQRRIEQSGEAPVRPERSSSRNRTT